MKFELLASSRKDVQKNPAKRISGSFCKIWEMETAIAVFPDPGLPERQKICGESLASALAQSSICSRTSNLVPAWHGRKLRGRLSSTAFGAFKRLVRIPGSSLAGER